MIYRHKVGVLRYYNIMKPFWIGVLIADILIGLLILALWMYL